MQVGVANQKLAGAFLQGNTGKFLDSKVVLVVAVELQVLYIFPIVDAVMHPGGDFGEIQLRAMERGVYVGAEIGTEDREGFAIEAAALDRLKKRVNLILGIEPTGLQAWPAIGVACVLTAELSIGL